MDRVFLLSPARCSGVRAGYLFRPTADFETAVRLRAGVATLADVFTFMSGLYFRGKVAYAEAFGMRCDDQPSAFVIVPGRGLVPMQQLITLRQLRAVARVPVHLDEERYCQPLLRDARRLARALPPEDQVVLLGSIASKKYTHLLSRALGDRLHYPAEFEGIGDMSRGALMLRRARSGEELSYVRFEPPIRNQGLRPARSPRSSILCTAPAASPPRMRESDRA